jgi:hypothetical protein
VLTSTQFQTQTSDAAKTSRLTENKRRYRARQKEYVSDLERRLTEIQERGVQATREVQLAGRQVVLENGRLRKLLRLAGFCDQDIDVWARCGDCGGYENGANFDQQREIEQKARRCAIFIASHRAEAVERVTTPSLSKNACETGIALAGHIPESADIPHSTEEPLSSKSNSHDLDSNTAAAACPASATSEDLTTVQVESHVYHDKQKPPCKLLTRLAENPAADITQVPVLPLSVDPLRDPMHHGEDVECGRAYEMLIRYATSEGKMDDIARTLEKGCTANGKGGCAVKSKVVWQALDNMCG